MRKASTVNASSVAVEREITSTALERVTAINNELDLLNTINTNLPALVTIGNNIEGILNSTLGGSSSEYCPGYTPVFATSSTFRIDGYDVTNLFYVARTLKLVDTTTFNAVITNSTYDGNNTTITIDTSEGTLTSALTDVCLTTGTAGWSPIAEDPFEGSSINAVEAGVIGTTPYVVAVGDFGKIFYSSDGGISWTNLPSGTTENLRNVGYNSFNRSFMVVGEFGVMLRTDDLTSVTPIDIGFQPRIHDIVWVEPANVWMFALQSGATTASVRTITDSGVYSTSPNASKTSLTSKLSYHQLGSGYEIYWASGDASNFLSSIASTNEIVIHAVGNTTCTDIVSFDSVSRNSLAVFDTGVYGIVGVRYDGINYGLNTTKRLNAVAISHTQNRSVVVGVDGYIGTIEKEHYTSSTSPVVINRTNGFSPTATITDVIWSDDLGIFIAVADNGQICRSTNGIN